MNYEEFLDYVKESVSRFMGGEYTVTLNKVMKNNGLELTGLVIMKKQQMAAPTIYLDDFYEQYNLGREMKEIFEEIIEIYDENCHKFNMDFTFFMDYHQVKDRVMYKLLNYEQNRQLLEEVPYRRFLDLAVVFYVEINHDDLGYGSVLIHNNHLDVWNITEKELYEAARENTPKRLKYQFSSMEGIVDELFGTILHQDILESEDTPGHDMYVLTNCNMLFGASCMMYEGLIRKISEKLDCNLYILPSSIHELIIIPQDGFAESKKELCALVRYVNENQVEQVDRLSDCVYEYIREKDEICI